MKLHCVFKIVFIFSKVLFLAPQSEAARSSNPARGAFTVRRPRQRHPPTGMVFREAGRAGAEGRGGVMFSDLLKMCFRSVGEITAKELFSD